MLQVLYYWKCTCLFAHRAGEVRSDLRLVQSHEPQHELANVGVTS